jgi:hypothetical protein
MKKANEYAVMESYMDSVVHEMILSLNDKDDKMFDAYLVFRGILQETIQAKFPDHKFDNF